jgi:hypothetical protein
VQHPHLAGQRQLQITRFKHRPQQADFNIHGSTLGPGLTADSLVVHDFLMSNVREKHRAKDRQQMFQRVIGNVLGVRGDDVRTVVLPLLRGQRVRRFVKPLMGNSNSRRRSRSASLAIVLFAVCVDS